MDKKIDKAIEEHSLAFYQYGLNRGADIRPKPTKLRKAIQSLLDEKMLAKDKQLEEAELKAQKEVLEWVYDLKLNPFEKIRLDYKIKSFEMRLSQH